MQVASEPKRRWPRGRGKWSRGLLNKGSPSTGQEEDRPEKEKSKKEARANAKSKDQAQKEQGAAAMCCATQPPPVSGRYWTNPEVRNPGAEPRHDLDP